MKVKYIGESFGVDSLTNGKIYNAEEAEDGMLTVVDDSGEAFLYSKIEPGPLWDENIRGKWEIIEK